ncbi:MAG: aminotransferase class I/II-fold pyridoxal phosphate-dependent enzyme [Vampirovibrionales bacterium]|nr:aminotransferase class I/II-fold pyridoxal phosphate-dependent enzyme [Vampirovibrionales bacterium]
MTSALLKPSMLITPAGRTQRFTESTIREMSRLAAQYQATNLAQGMPNFPCLDVLKQAAADAINADINQYSFTWGDARLREAIAAKVATYNGLTYNPETEITVTCGAAEGLAGSLLAFVEPGDEVIILEPFYENYLPNVVLAGGIPKTVALEAPTPENPTWHLNEATLREAFNDKTKVILLNSPHNPTGKVFTLAEMTLIAELCQRYNVLCISDEIYEHMVYDGERHVCMASLPGMRERTITLNSLSKTYSITGWRVGWMLAAPALTHALRKVHDFMTTCAPAPLQRAGVTALGFEQHYYDTLLAGYEERRQAIITMLDDLGIEFAQPQGAYYLLADVTDVCERQHLPNDRAFAEWLCKEHQVAVVPGSGFFHTTQPKRYYVRVCYSKTLETLTDAGKKLAALKA